MKEPYPAKKNSFCNICMLPITKGEMVTINKTLVHLECSVKLEERKSRLKLKTGKQSRKDRATFFRGEKGRVVRETKTQ